MASPPAVAQLSTTNAFSKEERIAWEQILEGFHDQLVMSKAVTVFQNDQTAMARQGDVIRRPMPYIARSFSGLDQTANFVGKTQLTVPAVIDTIRSSPWTMDATELRDALQEGRLGAAAKQKIASDINLAVVNAVSQLGSLVVKRTVTATGFDDLAQADSLMNEQGIDYDDRYAVFGSRDYNAMAGNLAARSYMVEGQKAADAYEMATVGRRVAGFERVLKADYIQRLTAAAGVTVTVNGANQYTVPKAITTTPGGALQTNVDNRIQALAITVASGTVKVGDAFTIAGVNNVHPITKVDTGQLKTFRVVGIVSGAGGTGTIQITPSIISGTGGTDAELAYQNCTAAPATGAAITWLNTANAAVNCFWKKEAVEILPGRLAVPSDQGLAVMRGTTDQGIELVMTKQAHIETYKSLYRIDAFFGVSVTNPEMTGIMLFNQV
ncbi:P22 phage major capsid protein family protein [Robbsia andropogonis]|uniref:P22 phage major capsid protein family protein n=1 Tax=Robbsia andropogonis TaxID=28092 RepID=UPI0004665BA9|nr:P22 phage major capsid protein family protein [Robbsia andropogonis]